MRLGDDGHVSFLLLAPNVVAIREVPTERMPFDKQLLQRMGIDPERAGEPTAYATEEVVDGTVETGETKCYPARVVATDGKLVQATGWNDRGEPVAWRDVRVGTKPNAIPDDPAGHVFHLSGDCPFKR